jgi:hypothetical protein
VNVLEQCKLEDDENVELWYLLGVAYYLKARPDLEAAKAHLQMAQVLLGRLKEMGERCDYQEALVKQQLDLVLEAEKNGGCKGGQGGGGEDEDEEESSDSESDDEEQDEEGMDMTEDN